MINDINNIENIDDFEQFMAELAMTRNMLRWAMYDAALIASQKGISQKDIASILNCSQAKISQYIKSAVVFPEKVRHYDVPVTLYDACRDVKDTGLNPVEVLEKALEEGFSPRQVREYIENNRKNKVNNGNVIKGKGTMTWTGNEIRIVPDFSGVDVGKNSITTKNVEVKYAIKPK